MAKWRGRDTAATSRLELLILQPTPFCNINCDYCYLPGRHIKKMMSAETLARTFERVFSSPMVADRFTVIWHAGEPLVLRPAYYEGMFAVIDRLNTRKIRIDHSIQSNGTLIDQRWIDFFKSHSIRLGLSLDGPRHLHDAHRRTRRGTGTFDAVMRGVRLLNDSRVDFHVITVLSAASLDAPDELFEFYVANGIRQVGFNIEEIEGENASSSLDGRDATVRFQDFLRRFLHLTKASGGALTVREFCGAAGVIADPRCAGYGNPQVEPLRIISVDVDGNLSTFSPELLGGRDARYGDFIFANVHRNEISDVLRSAKFQQVFQDIRTGLEQCRRECQYFPVCGGGAPSNKLFENGRFDSTETMYCRLTKKAIIDVILEDLEHDLGLDHPEHREER